MKATRLRCEYLDNPCGIDILSPRLSWNVEGLKKQTKAEISYRINDGEEKIQSVDSDKMMVSLKEELKSRDRVEWKVRVYDENNNVSPYSEPSYFSIGLLNKEDWKAKWIKGDYKVSKKKPSNGAVGG